MYISIVCTILWPKKKSNETLSHISTSSPVQFPVIPHTKIHHFKVVSLDIFCCVKAVPQTKKKVLSHTVGLKLIKIKLQTISQICILIDLYFNLIIRDLMKAIV